MQWESSGSIGAGGSYRRPNFPLVCRVAESVIQVNHNAQDIEQRQRMSNLTVLSRTASSFEAHEYRSTLS